MADGLNWFTDLDRLAQKLSAAADELDKDTVAIIEHGLRNAAGEARRVVYSGGVNKTKKGGARYISGDMVRSIDSQVTINGRGRAQGKWGFINDAPDYTGYQEQGTKNIAAMLALTQANEDLYEYLSSQLRAGRWLDVI